MMDDERISRWVTDCKTLTKRVTALVTNHHIYQELLDIVIKSKIANEPSYFFSWLEQIYWSFTLVAIRSICEFDANRNQHKKRERTTSLHLLLSDIRDHCELLTPEKQKSYTPEEFAARYGSDAEHFPKAEVEQDLLLLETCTKQVNDFTSQRITHLDRKPKTPLELKKDNAEEAIKCVEKLANKYISLLTGYSRIFKATLIPPWQTIFRHAWIE